MKSTADQFSGIQGHDLGHKFKALVSHNGVFSCPNMVSTDELFFPLYEFGVASFYDPSIVRGQPQFPKQDSDKNNLWQRWDPAEHLDKWSTPELVIANSRDYRITMSDGLATFNVLQARGIDSEFLTFPDETHFVLKPENSLCWNRVVLNWMSKHVGLPPCTDLTPKDADFFGGVEGKEEDVGATMPAQDHPGT